MHNNIWYDKNLCSTNLCDQRLTRIICINISHAEICCFTVPVPGGGMGGGGAGAFGPGGGGGGGPPLISIVGGGPTR